MYIISYNKKYRNYYVSIWIIVYIIFWEVFAMSVMDVFSSASKGASDKAKNMSELSNLKKKIMYEEERIMEIFTDIGKKYYLNPNEDPAEFKKLCDDINIRRRRIKKMKFDFNNIKGCKICPKCGAEVSAKFQFCGSCGASIPDPNLDDDDTSDITLSYTYQID